MAGASAKAARSSSSKASKLDTYFDELAETFVKHVRDVLPKIKKGAHHRLAIRNYVKFNDTRILNQAASEQLLPLVYEELRVLARQRLANEKPGQTLQATALVHEAYLRLVGNDNDQSWDNRGHFFAAAAEAMRRRFGDNNAGIFVGR
jgi:hypothetical protein